MAANPNDVLAQHAEDILQMDANAEINTLERLGLDWADKDENANILEETKKTLLAQLVSEQQVATRATGGKVLSMSQAENNAMADPRYEAHLQGMSAARGDANRAKVKYDTARVRIELLRSLVAARREEMRLSGVRT